MVLDPTSRPCYICGPFASPYSTAIHYDNLIVVASGIGITPAMSVITTHSASRRINLVWVGAANPPWHSLMMMIIISLFGQLGL
jgi:NAD(P)H-flavin reductase